MTVQASDFRLGARLTKEQLGSFSGWKSLAPIYRGDDMIAFLGMRAGFRGRWALYPVTGVTRANAQVDGFGPNDSNYQSIMVYGGRDSAIERLVEGLNPGHYMSEQNAKNFKTVSEQRAERANAKSAEAEASAARMASLTKYQADRENRLADLESILALTALSDMQRAALVETVKLLRSETEHYARQLANLQREAA
jgi:hypothetical protein